MNGKPNILQDIATKTQKIPGKLFPMLQNGQAAKAVPKHLQKITYENTNLTIIRLPDKKNVSYLKRKYNFHPLHLDDVLSPLQRPKIDTEETYLFFVLHFPQFNITSKRIESAELDFFLTKNDAVMIINQPFETIEKIISKIARKNLEREKYFKKGPGFLLYFILDDLIDSIFPLVTQLEQEVESIDKDVFEKEGRYAVETISFLRRNVIFFQTIVKPELASFRDVEKLAHPLLDKELKAYFGNLTDHLTKQWDRLEDVKELTDSLSLTVESYFSLKTNEIIKILTMFSVVLMPLTLLSGIYGMNLAFLPLADHPMALFLITLIMCSIIATMLIFFKIRKWI